MESHNVLLTAFPAQGHLNPTLQFAKRLAKMGVSVTFFTSFTALRRIKSTPPAGIIFFGFSDGYDDGLKAASDVENYMAEIRVRGSVAVEEIVAARAREGRPFVHVIYATLFPWVADVARRLGLPSTLLWIQPATVLDIYYFYFNGYGDAIRHSFDDHSISVKLPGLQPLAGRDLPSFFFPSNAGVYRFSLPLFKEHVDVLDREGNPVVLVNTIEGLEPEALRAIENYKMMAIGPLIPSAFLDGEDPSDKSAVADLFEETDEYVDWLDSKPKSSVVYVSFGSYSQLSEQQLEEITRGLLESRVPFLWVLRDDNAARKNSKYIEEMAAEMERQGKIVSWCSQVEVLSHPSTGCFLTHCGWNSTSESLVCGVPLIAVPQWTDQTTNSKLVQDVWKTGIRAATDDGGMVRGDEIRRCLTEVTSGRERGVEMRSNASKCKVLAKEAVKEGGASDVNLKAFVCGLVSKESCESVVKL